MEILASILGIFAFAMLIALYQVYVRYEQKADQLQYILDMFKVIPVEFYIGEQKFNVFLLSVDGGFHYSVVVPVDFGWKILGDAETLHPGITLAVKEYRLIAERISRYGSTNMKPTEAENVPKIVSIGDAL